MYDYTSNNWSHRNSNEKLKEKFGNGTRKTLDRFTTKDSYTWNITHNTESTAMWSLKPECWGSPLFQEKYQEEMPVTRDEEDGDSNDNDDDDDNDNDNKAGDVKNREWSVMQCSKVQWSEVMILGEMNVLSLIGSFM